MNKTEMETEPNYRTGKQKNAGRNRTVLNSWSYRTRIEQEPWWPWSLLFGFWVLISSTNWQTIINATMLP